MLPTLVYDDCCGPCARMKGVVAFLDPHRGIRCLGIDEAEGEGLLSGVSPALRRRSFHFISPDGSVRSGAGAIPELAAHLPGGALAARGLALPAVSWPVSSAYAVLSRLHERGSCPSDKSPETRVRG